MFPVRIASVGHAASGTQGLQALMWGENGAVKVFAGGMALKMREEVRHSDEKLERTRLDRLLTKSRCGMITMDAKRRMYLIY